MIPILTDSQGVLLRVLSTESDSKKSAIFRIGLISLQSPTARQQSNGIRCIISFNGSFQPSTCHFSGARSSRGMLLVVYCTRRNVDAGQHNHQWHVTAVQGHCTRQLQRIQALPHAHQTASEMFKHPRAYHLKRHEGGNRNSWASSLSYLLVWRTRMTPSSALTGMTTVRTRGMMWHSFPP